MKIRPAPYSFGVGERTDVIIFHDGVYSSSRYNYPIVSSEHNRELIFEQYLKRRDTPWPR